MSFLTMNTNTNTNTNTNKKVSFIIISILFSILLVSSLLIILYKSFLIGIVLFGIFILTCVVICFFIISGIKKTLITLFFFTLAFNIEFPLYPFNGGYSLSHPGGLRGALVINHFYIILLGLILLFFKDFIKKHFISRKHLFSLEIILFILFTLSSIISLFFADNKAAALYIVVRLIFMMFLLFILLKYSFSNIIEIFFKGIILLLPIQFIIGITQYITGKPVGLRILGESKNPFRADTVYGAAERGLSGTLGHPGILGIFIATIIPFLVLYYLNSEKKTKTNNIIIFLSLLQSTTLITLTNARTSIIIMLFTFLLAFLGAAVIKYRSNEPANKLLWYITIFILLILAFIFLFADEMMARFGNSDLLYQASYRGNLSEISWGIITDNLKNFLIGVGPNNYTDTISKMGDGFAYSQPVHNMYLLLFAEVGAIHALSYVCILLVILIKMISVIIEKGKNAYYALAIVISTINIMLYNFTGWANYNNQNFIFFVIMCALSIKIYEEHKHTRLEKL